MFFLRLLGTIGPILFSLLVIRSIYSLYLTFQAPVCDTNIEQVCYKSYLNNLPDLDLFVFVGDNSKSGVFKRILLVEKFNYNEPFARDIPLKIPESVRNNGSIFIYSVVLPSKRRSRDAGLYELMNAQDSSYVKNKLTKHIVPVSSTYNLLKESNNRGKIVAKPYTHIYSEYAFVICNEALNIPHNEVPFEIANLLRITPERTFLPILRRDFLNMRMKDLQEITFQSNEVTFKYIYRPVSFGKLRFLLQIEMSLRQFLDLGFTEKDLDEVKGVFADTNLFLLCATLCIGSIHLLLDFLSFKNDVSFWRSQTSMAGLSTRTVVWRAFSQTIVFLYLLDEGTSLIVLIPSGIATIIEFWKVSKVLKTSISWKGIKFDKDNKETDEEKETRKYDEECMRYLSYVLYPLCVGAAFYSLIYQPHKSWYSWTINSLVNAVYAFGFLFMLPQLFINYRLKSVAALPWRAFTYRAFNTFIDDIFAFIITMPTAHRVACFRDDIVFLVYLYQRWLYPVDKSRIDDIVGETILEAEDDMQKNKKDN